MYCKADETEPSDIECNQLADLEVPEHLQELFDTTVEQANLAEDNQLSLATVLRRNAFTFDTRPTDIDRVLRPPST